MENENIKTEVFEDECLLHKVCRTFHKFDFGTILSYIAVSSFISSECIYFIKVIKKRMSNQEPKDRCRHVVFSGENHFKEFYLQKARSNNFN